MFRTGLLASACIVTVLTIACGSDNPTGPSPQSQPEITNLADDFQFQVTDLSGLAQTYTYDWSNTGTSANVNHSGNISSGTATLILRDSSGSERYNRSLLPTGTFTSTTGTSGTWQIEIRLLDVRGTVNFRVQRGS
jgi:hypothetical protein